MLNKVGKEEGVPITLRCSAVDATLLPRMSQTRAEDSLRTHVALSKRKY